MKRWWLLSAIGAVSALVLIQFPWPDRPAASPRHQASPDGVEAQPQPDVRVEHVLVEAELVKPAQAPQAARPDPTVLANGRTTPPAGWAHASTRSSEAVLHRAQTTTPPPLFERAKRAFLGNGRHRPEPFPRVKDN